jgi:transcriptional regulator with XRE-family HTH domain
MMLAAKIADAMAARKISKKQFAELVGQSPSVITKWLSGGHNFTVDTLTDIQRVLGVRLLALDEKPVIQKVFNVTINVMSTISQVVPHPSQGRPYSVPSSFGGGHVTKPEGNFNRTFALA